MTNLDPQYPQQPYPYNQQSDCGIAIVSMIFGIAGYVFLPFIGPLVAIICGHIAKSQIRASQGRLRGNGMATAGLVLGYVQLGLVVLCILVITVILIVTPSSMTY